MEGVRPLRETSAPVEATQERSPTENAFHSPELQCQAHVMVIEGMQERLPAANKRVLTSFAAVTGRVLWGLDEQGRVERCDVGARLAGE
ncbi:MAG TPA: hypothetical protein VF267_00580 [Gammaproteobacteria bacterium]